ncbi:MAG: hypothetical protein WBA61_05000 [Aequorivita sp.]
MELLGFIPILLVAGVIYLIVLYGKNPKKMREILIFTLIGGLLGVPLSYFFQSSSRSMASYLRHFDDGLSEDFLGNVIIGVIIFAVIGTIIGYIINKKGLPKVG